MHTRWSLLMFIPMAGHASPTPSAKKLETTLTDTVTELARNRILTERQMLPYQLLLDGDGTTWVRDVDPEPASGRSRGVGDLDRPVIAIAVDRTAAWLAVEIAEHELFFQEPVAPIARHRHGLLLAEIDGDGNVHPIVSDLGLAVAAKDEAKIVANSKPEALADHVTDDAKPVVERWKATVGSTGKLAATVATRDDVVLFGSGTGERYVGAAAVKAQLQRWNLEVKLRGGIVAGVTKSKTVAWVAADVETHAARSKSKPTPYRALFLYELTGHAWQLVHASFSVIDTNLTD